MGLLITQRNYLAQQHGHKGFYQQISVQFTVAHRLFYHPQINTLTILTASSSPLRLGLPSASPNESSVGGSVASVGGSLTWEAEDLEGELFLGAGVGAAGH